jgi:hypothetical protein
VPRFQKLIKDIDLQRPELLREERIPLSPDTYAVLVELAKKKVSQLEMAQKEKFLTHKKALELAVFWVQSGSADPKIVQKLYRSAPLKTREQLHESCLEAFLKEKPEYKIREKVESSSGGRPKGYIPPAKRVRLAMGQVISELINENYSVVKKLKAA